MTPQDIALSEDIAQFYDDPLGFVMYAYEWDDDPRLQIVELQEPWASRYGCKYGPDVWACEELDAIGAAVRERAFNGRDAVPAIRRSVSSGHGIGKSAFTAWLVNWISSTRPHSRGVVTANTAEQLSSKTWAEIAKWTKRCITGHWFTVTTGKGAMRLQHKQHPESWRCDAQTCKEENSEAFAGLHAVDSTPYYIFDEASAVPAAIYDVAEGGLTDGEPHFYLFGNPTRTDGRFYDTFNRLRHRWANRQIDSRNVAITNKKQIAEWLEDNGEDSDFFKVRVRGVFPSASSQQFIAREPIDAAMARVAETRPLAGLTAAVGVDIARSGDAQSVIRTRVGRDGTAWPPVRMRIPDTTQVAARVARHIDTLRSGGLYVVVMIDGGGVGGGVIDRLRQLSYECIEVQFGADAQDPKRFKNKRSEMWYDMREWLKGGVLTYDEQLITDLTGPEYSYNDIDQLVLEPKKQMIARGLASPDDGDALALTFAQPVPETLHMTDNAPPANTVSRNDYDPYAAA